MSENDSLAMRVFEMVHAVRSGEIDPLELRLTEAYKELQNLASKIDSRIDIDEMLNEILSTKVHRVQELARVLAAPEIYVNRLKCHSTRDLAKLLTPKQPVIIGQLEHTSLEKALDRIVQLIDAMAREPLEDPIPKITDLPNGYALETEDSVFLEDLEKFLQTLDNGKIIFDDLVKSDERSSLFTRSSNMIFPLSRDST
jgi:hypothetical protein